MAKVDSAAPFKAILAGGSIAALLDILDPILFFHFGSGAPAERILFFHFGSGAPAERILQSVATGVLGRAAYSGGARTALLGLGLHILIAFLWASLFVLLGRFISFLSEHPVRSGLLFGAIVYVVMNYAVLPLSRVTIRPHIPAVELINGILAMLLLVGLPISFANRRFAPYPRS